MKHCENCNCKEEWVKIPELNIELSSVTPIKSEKEIKISQGSRLPTYAEYALAIEKGIIPFTEEWVEYCTSPLYVGVRAVWLNVLTDRFYLCCSSIPVDFYGRVRGVRFVREIK